MTETVDRGKAYRRCVDCARNDVTLVKWCGIHGWLCEVCETVHSCPAHGGTAVKGGAPFRAGDTPPVNGH